MSVFHYSNYSWALSSESFHIFSSGGSILFTLAHGTLSLQHFPSAGKDRAPLGAWSGRLIEWSQAVVPRAKAPEFVNRASVSKQTYNTHICQHPNIGCTRQRLWKLTHLFQSKQIMIGLGYWDAHTFVYISQNCFPQKKQTAGGIAII